MTIYQFAFSKRKVQKTTTTTTTTTTGPSLSLWSKCHSRQCLFVVCFGLIAIQMHTGLSPLSDYTQDQPYYSNTVFNSRNVASIENSTSTAKRRQQHHPLLNCSAIANLPILGTLGKGKQKIALQVKLPWGETAVAKRCLSQACLDGKKYPYPEAPFLEWEAHLFGRLQQQNEGQSVGFYGECHMPYVTNMNGQAVLFDEPTLYNFSIGSTILLEVGTPLAKYWGDPWNATTSLTDADVEDLRWVARQFATAQPPVLLGASGKFTDQIYPQQYARIKAGLRLVDVDTVIACDDLFKDVACASADSALNLNCHVVLHGLAGISKSDPRFNCTEAYSHTSSDTRSTVSRTVATKGIIDPISHNNKKESSNNDKKTICTHCNLDEIKPPPFTPGAFLHVGKTGGRSLSSQLRNGCASVVPKPCFQVQNESYISKHTEYFHTDDNHLLGKLYNRHHYDFFVITVRDPLARTISAFTYMHPHNVQARAKGQTLPSYKRVKQSTMDLFQCFPTLQKFARDIGNAHDEFAWLPNFDDNDLGNCTNVARAMIHSKVQLTNHFFYDVEATMGYLSENTKAKQNATLLVVRMEDLWKDWTTANEWLGQTNVVTFPEMTRSNDFSNLKLPVGRDLDEEGRRMLCLALGSEYQAYLEVLRMAINLSPQDRIKSLQLAQKSCPWLNLTLE